MNSYVVVIYEGEYFPGIITNEKDGEFLVKVLSGPSWRWPEREDLVWYKRDDVIQAILEPKLNNARGIYEVEEMAAFRKI